MKTTESGLKFEVSHGGEILGRFNSIGAALLRLKIRAGIDLDKKTEPRREIVEKSVALLGKYELRGIVIRPTFS